MRIAETTQPPPRVQKSLNNTPLFAIPYVSEAFTRVAKRELKRNNIEARVVIRGTGNLKQRYHKALNPPCTCSICQLGTPCCQRHVIYQAECSHCTQNYKGVTTRPFCKRFKEHEASIRLGNYKSALSQHFLGDEDHSPCSNPDKTVLGFNWSVLDRGKSYKDSFIREGVLINSTSPEINRNTPGWVKYFKL